MLRQLAALLALLLPACGTRQVPPEPVRADLALTNVHLIDVTDGSLRRDQVVAVTGNRITWLGAASHARFSTATPVIDAAGAYLIPGLWDMHVHVMYRQGYDVFGPLFLAYGITGIRDMGNSPMPLHGMRQLREQVARGERAGPRFVAAGPLLDGPASFWPFAIRIPSPERAVHVVDSLHAEGAEFLKVYSGLPAAAYDAIARRARELGTPVVGHVPSSVRVEDAIAAGQRSMEHLLGVHEGCAANPHAMAEERSRLADARAAGDTTIDLDLIQRRVFGASMPDASRCATLLDVLARNRVWHTPTLAVHRIAAFPLDSTALDDARIAFVAPAIRSWWTLHPRDTSAAAWEVRRRRYAYDAQLVAAMHEAGVPLLAGSDAPNRFLVPAFSLHEELAALVDAGVSPLGALRAATLEPARFLGATDSLGTVALGKLADLVLLAANPLEDIRHASRVVGVVYDGRYLDRVKLDSLIGSARTAALPSP